ncbi:MAG: cobyrinate a,c-diamide synthase [Ruminococcus sp.]|nr:cobyrinate a,c-diamide synthase [Ruminococcus sp.]
MRRMIIGGTHSGCGKTTVTCAILQALCDRGMQVASFKCGPDYIDPMFHEKIIGTDAYNLDSFFCTDNTLRYLLYENSCCKDAAVIEGVMGFYDGAGGRGSACSLAQITDTPAVIVIDCKGMSDSIGAVMKGFLTYREPNCIAGFIFNRLPERRSGFAERLCAELGTEYFGFLPANSITIESRHLGLVTADEIANLKENMHFLGDLAQKHILLDKLLKQSERTVPIYEASIVPSLDFPHAPVIAVARDRAFCFIYQDNIALLKKLGCKIVYFSPLEDSHVPNHADGMLLSGGYPELYAKKLSENCSMLADIRKKIEAGMPCIAECGGFLYLHDTLEDAKGNHYHMAGVIEGKAYQTQRLQRFGYVTMTAGADNILCKKGEAIPAHEFHYWDSTACGEGFTARKMDGRQWKCVHANEHLYAGFPHLYFYSDIRIAKKFAGACAQYGGGNG